MIHFVVREGADFTIHEYLSLWGRDLAHRFRVLHYENLPSRTSFDRGTYVLAEFGRLSPGLRSFLAELHRQLSPVEGIRFLNHPTRTLGRFELLAELRRLDRNEFRAVRATEDFTALRYPVFVRSDLFHDGALSPLLRSPREVDAAIGRALLLGRSLKDLLVVEFCDTADADGFYRKYAAYIVGDRVLARSLAYGHAWMLKHAQTEFSRPMVEEERDYVLANPHERQLAEIFAIAGVQYGRIDYAVKDGRIQTWEINRHPTIGRGPHPPRKRVPPELEPLREKTKEHFYRGFAAAWEAADLPDARPAVEVAFDSSTMRGALETQPRRGRLLDTARRLLRPVKPLLEPVSRPVLSLLGRLARRGQR
ncbi:MAG: hypothetical protein ACRD3M_10340 [Thermoanaerobaculia bacterium]